MSNSEMILELLGEIYPGSYCDDCMSVELGIHPRQQVNQICRKLESQGKLIRQEGSCEKCQKEKKINILNKESQAIKIRINAELKKNSRASAYSIGRIEDVTGQIDRLRAAIVKICQQIWAANKSEKPPRSISKIINILREDGLIPSLQAGLMLTICNLRNAGLYEDVKMSAKETTIATNAWDIISEWWEKKLKSDKSRA
ncbi:MAG: hypothetical protein PHU81_00040 [Acidobacteriota bacterium]|nr:hypothetical protein [Acidobacteriota bacterium]